MYVCIYIYICVLCTPRARTYRCQEHSQGGLTTTDRFDNLPLKKEKSKQRDTLELGIGNRYSLVNVWYAGC